MSNITEHFFKKLSGELIILSTDEELSCTHLKSMSDQIAQVYMLDYGEDKRTYVHTLKRFRPDGEVVRLHAENPNYDDIVVDDCVIQGVAVKVLKDLN